MVLVLKPPSGAAGDKADLAQQSGAPLTADIVDLAAVPAVIDPGTVLGRQIDAVAGAPVPLTGLEQGENLRFRTEQVTSAAGAGQTLALAADTNLVNKNGGASVNFLGFVGGQAGRIVLLRHTSGGGTTTTLEQDSGANPAEGFLCPGAVPFVYGGSSGGTSPIAGFVYYDTTSNRWVVFPRGMSRAENVDWTGNHSFTSPANFVVDATGEARLRSLDGMCLVSGHPNYAAVAAGDVVVAANSGVLIAATAVAPTAAAGTGVVDVQSDSSFRVTTNGVERLEIENDGAWQLAGVTGTDSQIMESTGASSAPQWSGPRSITLSITVPAVAAGSVGYASTSLVGTALENLISPNAGVIVNPQTDLVAAGAGGGFINARISAVNTLRTAFLGPLAGGAANFTVSKVR